MWLALLVLLPLQAQPPELESLSERARQAMQEERWADAEKAYAEMVRRAPDNPGLLVSLGIAQHSGGRHQQAAAQFEAAVKIEPRFPEAWLMLGLARRKLGQPAGAAEAFRQVLKLDGANHVAVLELAEALLDSGDPAEASTSFYKMTQVEPGNPRVWFGLAVSYLRLGSAAFGRLESAAPESACWYVVLGRAHARRGSYPAAAAFYRRAIELDAGLRGPRTALAEIYRATGHADWAAAILKAELPKPDCRAEPLECEFEDERYWQLIEAALPQKTPKSYYWQTLAYEELAGMALTRLAELPLSGERFEFLARIYRLQGRHGESVKAWRQALLLTPTDKRLQEEFQASRWLSGERSLPISEVLEKAVRELDDDGALTTALAAACRKAGRADQAAALAARARQLATGARGRAARWAAAATLSAP